MKKGLFSTPAYFISSIIIIVFSLLIYAVFVLISDGGSQVLNPITLQHNDVDANLLEFLDSAVVFNEESFSVAGLINVWHYDKDSDGIIQSSVEKTFKALYGDCYNLAIYDNSVLLKSFGQSQLSEEFAVVAKIPAFDGDLDVVLNPSNYYIFLEKENLGVCNVNV